MDSYCKAGKRRAGLLSGLVTKMNGLQLLWRCPDDVKGRTGAGGWGSGVT